VSAGELSDSRRQVERLHLTVAGRAQNPPAISTDVAREQNQGDGRSLLPGGLICGRCDPDEKTAIFNPEASFTRGAGETHCVHSDALLNGGSSRLRLGAVGAALGIVAALGVSGLLGSVLFGVSATDAISFARALAVVLGGVVVATLLPAWRAARTNPLSALRHQ
jgi:hypothetical protein